MRFGDSSTVPNLLNMALRVLELSSKGYKIIKCQKLGIILENKVVEKLMSSKNVNNKKCAPKLIFFNENKKLRKIWMIFGIENWLWKTNFGTFWQLAINPNLKIVDS